MNPNPAHDRAEGALPRSEPRVGIVSSDAALVEHLGIALGDVELIAAPSRDAVANDNAGVPQMLVVDDTEDSGEIVLEVPNPREQRAAVRYAYERDALDALISDLQSRIPASTKADDPFATIRGASKQIELVREQLRSVSRFADVSVLVLGDTGTGKELVARALHEATFGPEAPFVAINCAAIPEHLIESELFGHEAGAYTGARGAKVGLLEAAAGGSVFLDEVGEMPAALQPKLLRVLESREFRRIGSTKTRAFEARVLSATNREPWDRDAALRSDLTYRLAGFTVRLPPLRERGDDVTLLGYHFLRAFEARHGLPSLQLEPVARELLAAHDWPGNVRELKATLEHAAILADGGVIGSRQLRSALAAHRREAPSPPVAAAPTTERAHGLRAVERQLILEAMERHGGNVSRAARELGLPRSTLRSKLERLSNV